MSTAVATAVIVALVHLRGAWNCRFSSGIYIYGFLSFLSFLPLFFLESLSSGSDFLDNIGGVDDSIQQISGFALVGRVAAVGDHAAIDAKWKGVSSLENGAGRLTK